MPLKDLREAINGTHKLPIGGNVYVVEPITAELGLQFQDLMEVAATAKKASDAGAEYSPSADEEEVLNDAAEKDLYREALGPAHDLMVEDGVRFAELKLAALYVIFHAVYGDTFAAAYWASGGKAPAPNRAARRTETRTRTAAANTTKSQASRNGTTTRKATPKRAG
jgi:hypothetical protein